jgi:hypothetical protein
MRFDPTVDRLDECLARTLLALILQRSDWHKHSNQASQNRQGVVIFDSEKRAQKKRSPPYHRQTVQ